MEVDLSEDEDYLDNDDEEEEEEMEDDDDTDEDYGRRNGICLFLCK